MVVELAILVLVQVSQVVRAAGVNDDGALASSGDLRVDGGHATVALDADVAHSGRRSVRIEAAGKPAIVHVFQLDRPLPPGRGEAEGHEARRRGPRVLSGLRR